MMLKFLLLKFVQNKISCKKCFAIFYIKLCKLKEQVLLGRINNRSLKLAYRDQKKDIL